MPVADRSGDVVPLLNLAVHQVRRDLAADDVVHDPAGIAGLHLMQDDQRLARNMHVHQRLLAAGAEAADGGQEEVLAAVVDGLGESVVQAFGAIAPSAGSHAHRDARNRRQQLAQASLANGIEYADVLNARHYSTSRSSARTSRCRVRSFTWPQMR